jgi:drug/metabolite transporter (DMT)-like permease
MERNDGFPGTRGTGPGGSPGPNHPVTWTGLAHLFVVYLVWGSTYLAIRVAVREGSGFSPFFLGASRTLVAAAVLLLWNALRRQRIRPTRGEWITLVPAGLLMWVGGNGLVNWAERHADSGYAALLVGALPIWMVLMEAFLDRRRPTYHLMGALVVGFSGLGVLTYPMLRQATGAGLAEAAALIVAPLCWGAGSIYQLRRPTRFGPTASAAWLQGVGGVGFIFTALLLREPRPHPTPEAWAAWGYLVVAGSILAFTSYLTALRRLPISLVTTYTYVNPVIAVLLGWIILGEPITRWTIAGTVLVLAGVAGAFQEKRVQGRRAGSVSVPAPPSTAPREAL